MIESLRIGLSKYTLTVLAPRRRLLRGGYRVIELPVADPAQPLQTAVDSLRGLGRRAQLVLADEWVRYFMVTPPTAARSLDDCRAAARLRFLQLYGSPPDDWTIRADWQAGQAFLACALPAALLAHLHQSVAAAGLRLAAVQPQFVAAFNAWRRLDNHASWFAVCHRQQLMLGMLQHSRLVAVRPLQWSATEALDTLIRREALRLQLPLPRRIRWLGDATPAACEGLALLDMRTGLPEASPGTVLAATGAARCSGC